MAEYHVEDSLVPITKGKEGLGGFGFEPAFNEFYADGRHGGGEEEQRGTVASATLVGARTPRIPGPNSTVDGDGELQP
jgi:hypothetical protein